MELISPRPLTGAQELRQELFQRAEELERLVAICKHKLCGEETASLNYGSNLMKQSNTDVLGDQRGQFYDIYMRKREEKLREEWRARGAEKDAVMMAMMESLASTSFTVMNKRKVIESKKDNSTQTNSRKLSSRSSIPHPSTSQSSATATQNPTIRSSKSASLRNLKSSTGIINENSLQRSIARSQSSNDKMSLVKDIKARRSPSLRKNSLNFGEPKDFMHMNVPKPLLKKSNSTAPTAGLSKNKLRIPMVSQAPPSEMLKEGNEQVDLMRIENVRKLEFDKESWNSVYHRFESDSPIIESPELINPRIQNFLFDVHETTNFDSSVDSTCFDPTTIDSHNMNQYLEGKAVRVRKKWGSVERPFVAVDASTIPFMDVTKGIKRFLKFGKRNGGIEKHNDKKYDNDSENYSFVNPKNSRIGQIPSFSCFNEDGTRNEQVNMSHNPSHVASLEEKEKHPKQRLLSSLPPFQVRENENKSR